MRGSFEDAEACLVQEQQMAEKLYGEDNELTMLRVMRLDKFLSAHKIGNTFR